MHRRWQLLFACSLVTLGCVAWLTESLPAGRSVWLNPALLGMLAACGTATAALVAGARRRWPAAVVVLCAAPLGCSVVELLPRLPQFVASLGVPGLLVIVGTLATLAIGLFTLVAQPPPPHFEDPVPRARASPR